MLKTETNTDEIESRILKAFEVSDHAASDECAEGFEAHYEHGQWWIIATGSGVTWSVVDAEGGSSIDGFDFERL